MATTRIYASSNGDVWDLANDEAGVRVLHRPNAASGGAVTAYELDAFLARERHSPQNRALVALIGTLVDAAPDTHDT